MIIIDKLKNYIENMNGYDYNQTFTNKSNFSCK